MAPKRLLEQPPPANSSSADESEEEEVEEEETQSKSQNQNKKGVVAGADEEEKSEDDEEEEEEEEEEEDDDNEEGEGEEEAETAKSRKPTIAKPSESSGSGSETESDNNTPPSPSLSGFTVKPIASKPMDDNDDDGEDVDTTTTTTSAKPNKKKVLAARPNKRAAEAQESDPNEKDSKSNNKKRKVTSNGGGGGGGEEDDSKKVTRVWSEEDEISVLKGMTEYKTKKGADPYTDMGAFHDFIKKRLHADMRKNQLVDKIRRLKRKYLNNVAKGENGKDPVISKPHELKSFQLSKNIWGSGDNKNPSNGNLVEDNNLKSNSKKNLVSKSTATIVLALRGKDETGKKEKKREKAQANSKAKIVKEEEEGVEDEQDEEIEDVEEVKDFWEKYPNLKNSLRSSELECFVSSIKKVMPLIESSKVKKLDKKWKDLEIDEMEIFTRRAQLLGEQVKMVSDFVKFK